MTRIAGISGNEIRLRAAPGVDIQAATACVAGIDGQCFWRTAAHNIAENLFCTLFMKSVMSPIGHNILQERGVIDGGAGVFDLQAPPVGLTGDRTVGLEQIRAQRLVSGLRGVSL